MQEPRDRYDTYTHDDLVDVMQRAMDTQTGIVLQTDNRYLLRHQFYRVRRIKHHPEFEALSFIIPDEPYKDELWIIKRPKG